MSKDIFLKHAVPTSEDCAVELLVASGQEQVYSSFSFITRPDKDYGEGILAKQKNLKDRTQS